MKKNLLFITSFFILIILNGCDNKGENIDNESTILSELPPNLVLEVDPTTFESIKEAKIHKAEFFKFNSEEVAESILQEEIIHTEIYAEGPWFETEGNNNKEYLIIYDGGKSFGTSSGTHGGFNYSIIHENGALDKYSKVVALAPDPPSITTQRFGYDLNSDYETFVDLSFLPYSEAEAEIKSLFSSVGISNIEIDTVYALDVDMMQTHYNIYLEHMNDEESNDTFNWSIDDEAYLFHFRQTIDGIPLFNENWQSGVRSPNDITETVISSVYNKNGINSIYAVGLYHILESTDNKTIISGIEALNNVISHYDSIILTEETTIEHLELSYVSIREGDTYQLIPSWIIRIRTRTETAEDEPFSYDEYSYYVINAISGEQMNKASEQQ